MRSFFIQGCWNYEGMQNVGFAFGMMPVIEAVSRDKKERAGLLTYCLTYFNSHPYLASAIIGAAASVQMGRGVEAEREIREIKDTLSNPFAALGDALFWSTLKPLFSVTALIAALLGSFISPLIFLVLYNVFHLWVRSVGFVHGLRGRIDLMRYIKRMGIPNMSSHLKRITFVLLGLFVAGLSFFLPLPTVAGGGRWLGFLPVVGVLVVAFLVRRGVGVVAQIYLFSFVVMLICWLL
jgi:mannose/fructose/N-acetylgalactosamine-specific phosphotransferase system component IID